MKHTILGAGGSIGNALTSILLENHQEVRSVSRSHSGKEGVESITANLLSYTDTRESIEGTDIVYLCVGLPYDRKAWRESWPKIMKNTIDACKETGARLLFLDNVYMYGKVEGKMTESTPYNPCSVKGEIRAAIANLLEEEIKRKNINAIIARSADFYGPYSMTNSIPSMLVIDRMIKGKKAQWLVNADSIHSFTYTLDCAMGLYLLSGHDECFNQVWHLPTFNPGINGKTFIKLAATELNADVKYSILSKWMMRIAGLFDKTVFESNEMLYQSENDYYFDSTKFNSFFKFNPRPYPQGIHETIEFLKKA